MATELGVGYLSIVPETSKVIPGIDKALTGAQANADRAGQGMGSKIAGGIGTTLKFGAATAGAAAAGVIGTALTQGMARVVAIDDAKGKLAGLGHTAEGVTTIMDSALASVKGTAFGLGDAAGIAASAVAAGIKPGEELTKYLTLTGDAATIAGSSLEEMGSIFNKVQTSGKAYTDNLNQLADRGIPIFQWLQDEYGVTAEELSKMVKEGKVDAETFNKVIQENIGGAALESGKTLRGSFANMKAALGRAGAAVIEPFLPMMKAGLGKVMEFTDKVTPHLKAGAEKAAAGLTDMGRAFMSSGDSIEGPATKMERFGVKAREVVDGIKGVWSILSKGEFAGSKMTFGLEEDSKTVEILFKIREGAQALWDVIKSPSGEKFTTFLETIKGTGGEAANSMGKVESGANTLTGALKSIGSAAAGGATALVSLGGDTATVAVAGIKALGSVMGYFAEHTGVATTVLAGFAASVAIAKTVETGYQAAMIARTVMMPAQMLIQRQQTAALVAHTAMMRANIIAIGGSLPPEQASIASRARLAITTRLATAATASSTSSLMAYAAAQRAAAASSGLLIGGMRQAAASTAVMGARVAGAGSTAMSGLKSGLGSAVSLLGGPVAVGVMAAGAAVMYMGSKFSDANDKIKNSQKTYADYAVSVRDSNDDLKNAFNKSNGIADSGVLSVVEAQVNSARTAQKEFADSAPGIWGGIGSSIATVWDSVDGRIDGTAMKSFSTAEDLGKKGRDASAAFDKLNMSTSDIAKVLTGPKDAYKAFTDQILQTTEGGGALVDIFDKQRKTLEELKTPAGEFSAAVKAINDGSVSAASGIDAMNSALARQRGEQLSVEDAQQRVNDTLRAFSEAASAAGGSVINAAGQIDTGTAAGSRLYSEMKNVAGAMDEAGNAAYTSAIKQGQSHADAAQAAEDAGRKVQDSFVESAVAAGIPRDAVISLIEQYNLIPPNKTTYVKVESEEAAAKLNNLIALKNSLMDNLTLTPQVATPMATPLPFGILGSGQPGNHRGARLPKNSGGSRLPTVGPGTDTVDGFLGIGADGVPTTWADKGEWIINGKSSEKWNRVLGAINRDEPWLEKILPRHAAGGIVGTAVDAARSVTGVKYKWGGVGPDGFDCSGFVGWLQQILMGFGKATSRIYTTYSLIGGATAGLAKGLNSASPFNVGVSEEHMAATLDGQPVESGGSHGDSRIGAPAVGANDGQFPYKFHLPLDKIAGGYSPGSGTSANQYSSGESKWTEKDDLELESARVSIQQAKEARDKVYANEKKSDADRQQADLRVQRAEQRVIDLEAKREGAGSAKSYGPAPDLPGGMTDEAMELRNAEIAVTEAELARDRAYGEADSTSLDKEKADMAVYAARNRLSETQKKLLEEGNKSGDGSRLKTFAEIGSDLGGILANGLLETFGLQDSLLADPNKFFVDNTGPTGARTTEPLKKPKPLGATPATEIVAPPTMTISLSEAMTQLPFTPDWNDPLGTLKKLSAFDQGGEASGLGFMPKAILEPERVLSPRTTQDFNRLVGVLDRGDVLNDFESGNQRGGGSTTYAPTFTGLLDEEQMFSMFERWQRRTQTGGGQRTVAHRSRRR